MKPLSVAVKQASQIITSIFRVSINIFSCPLLYLYELNWKIKNEPIVPYMVFKLPARNRRRPSFQIIKNATPKLYDSKNGQQKEEQETVNNI